MKKIGFILMMLLVGVASRVHSQETVINDTVRCEESDSITRPQPTDDRYRVVTNRFFDNWFVLADFGGHAFFGDYSTLGKFSGLLSPDFNVGVGKWFTPGIGAKLQFGLSQSKGYSKEQNYFTYGDQLIADDGTPYWKSKNKWWDLSVSAMFNLSRLICGYEGKSSDRLMNQFIASVGIGALHHRGIEAQRNEWSGHFELQYSRFFDKEKKLSLDVKAHGILYQTNFDGITLKQNGEKSKWFDANVGLSVGLTYYFNKRYWERCLPCERPVYINQTIIPAEDCPEYGSLEFYVFFPNNYSGRDDAPTVSGASVNAIDYLASGVFTQRKFNDTKEVASRLAAGRSLDGLRTSDVPTKKASADAAGCGYEMSSTPISLSMRADSMNLFKDQEGYYYAPMYSGANTWYYRVDRTTLAQRLMETGNYKESQSFALNAHQGLDLVRDNMKPDTNAELFSFADVYGAIESGEGTVAAAMDTAAVSKVRDILSRGQILYVVAEGLATSQDNYVGENAQNVGLERNKSLAFNRAYTVVNWLKGNRLFKNVPTGTFAVNALSNPVSRVDDSSTRGLNAKLRRCVKVRINYVIRKK